MKLEQLYCFSEAAKYRSLSVAAEKNYMKPSSLSTIISKLERELGVRLLERNHRGVAPTQEGLLILDEVNEIFRSLENIEDIAKHHQSSPSIVVAATMAFCDVAISPILRAIEEHGLSYALSFVTLSSYMVYEQVASGLARVGITAYDAGLMSASLRFTPLFEDEYVLYIGPKSPFWDAGMMTREEFLTQPYIAFGEEFLDERADGWGKSLFDGQKHQVALRSNDYSTIRNCIMNENYVSFFPQFCAKRDPYITKGLLKAVTLSDFSLPVQYGCLESTHYKLSEKERQFVALVKECAAAL